ncbi:hypothetical protein SeLEV6574_g04615 [Synchytrium endobioticum]|nr:hypothetical protein SeLEV6574_g04615 [Synchytrium endobioticum]
MPLFLPVQPTTMSHDDHADLPGPMTPLHYADAAPRPLELLYATTDKEARHAINKLLLSAPVHTINDKPCNVLGFDTESKAQFVKGGPQRKTALIQLSTEACVALFHVCRMPRGLSAELRALLEDESYIKAGVAILGDAAGILQDFDVRMQSMVELPALAVSSVPEKMARCTPGLKSMLEGFLGRTITKAKKICLSNWEAPLTKRQKDYAANDAYASIALFQHLMKERSDRNNNKPIELISGASVVVKRPKFPSDAVQVPRNHEDKPEKSRAKGMGNQKGELGKSKAKRTRASPYVVPSKRGGEEAVATKDSDISTVQSSRRTIGDSEGGINPLHPYPPSYDAFTNMYYYQHTTLPQHDFNW